MEAIAFGRIEGGELSSALKAARSCVSDRAICVIRSIDSIYDSNDLAYSLGSHGIKASIVEGNVCVVGSDLYAAVNAGVFTGFDEIWVFRDAAPTISLRHATSATSATTDFSVEFPHDLRQLFEKSRCTLLLGDGSGLNFATVVQQLADKLLELKRY